MTWLHSIGGSSKTGIGACDTRGMIPIIRMSSPAGKHVNCTGDDTKEVLSDYMIAFYDRRLLVVSPFLTKTDSSISVK